MLSSAFQRSLALLFCSQVALCSVARPRCPAGCRCPEDPAVCAPGVHPVPAECACCRVCARQRGETCSQRAPCDARRGLRCDRRSWVCVANKGDSCMFNGVAYHNEETFFPSCSYQCMCREGQISCVPRCNLDVMLPGPDCPYPRKVQVPGECCEKWVCEPPTESSVLGALAMAAYRQEETVGFDQWDPSVNCIEQITEWSACSRTCGMGVSTRVTNKNPRCEMVKQSRLCMVRQCEGLKEQKATQQRGSKCLKIQKSTKAIHFSFKNCTSTQAFRPRFCGQCGDGRCCTPHSTKTAQVEFQCLENRVTKRPVMFINTCVCHHHCPRDNMAHQPSTDTGYDGLQL
ncbi:hypothetical protein AMEX_G8471 [Astyanax mexicanus]|uniref:CCN family member 3 n=1 Tax=Astyanax mexicanus TaxID=7994 RepID=A0A8B9RK71_ASTMX|nr:hypothetical protein AMEX_G8471 [Astyanax mexicanus]